MTARAKIGEAAFFIELLKALEERGSESLSHQRTKSEEASYLFSAILNAFYSCTAILLEGNSRLKPAIADFRASYPGIYRSETGERAKTVHIAHVHPAGSNYVPPGAKKINLIFRSTPRPAPKRRSTDLRFTPEFQIYVEVDRAHHRALAYFEEHLSTLKQFLDSVDDALEPPRSNAMA